MPDHQWENRWAVYRSMSFENAEPTKGDDGYWRVSSEEGKLTSFSVRDQYGNDDYEVVLGPDERAEADALAREFNRFERQGPLPDEFAARRQHLAKVPGTLFNVVYGEYPWNDPPAAPERYALVVFSDRYGESFIELVDDLSEALGRVAAEGDTTGVWDLDTGEQLSVQVTAVLA
jgi:hypothetical protein